MATATNICCNLSVQDTIHAPHPTTSTFRPKSARIEILHRCRQLSDDIRFSQSNGYPLHSYVTFSPYPFLVVQFVVAVKDEETKELWDCNPTLDFHQIHITKDRMFRIVPELSEPSCFVLAYSVDCGNKPLPPYAGNLVFKLPVKHETPSHYAVGIKLCKGANPRDCQVLDEVQFFIESHKRGSKLYDFQSGRTITEVEKPVPKIQMQGVLAGKMGKYIKTHFQKLGDNGQYNKFLRDRDRLVEQVNGKVKYQDLLSAVLLEEAIIYFGQNKMEDCLAKCWEVHARAMRHNSGNWPFLLTKAFYIISAVYRQEKKFDKADEYMEKSSECLEPASLSEETAVNKYNAAALMAEKSATLDLTAEEEREVERLFEEVAGIWSQQRENETLRCVIRSYNRMITYFLKTSRSAFPDLRKVVTEVELAKADEAIQKFETNLLPHSPKRLKATFLIGKADYYIRRATRKRTNLTQQQRATDFRKATSVLEEAMQISRELKMQKEIDGIRDRNETIQNLTQNDLQWLDERPLRNPLPSHDPSEENTDDMDVLLQNMFIEENE